MAEAKLNNVRPDFVAKVTKPLIGQLLDDLLHDRVVTNGEKDWILEENNVREDMARRLIDTVKPKGATASQMLIDYIQSRDPMLHSELGLSCDPPAPPAPAPQVEQQWSTSLIPTTAAFWMQKQNDPDIYPGTRESIGNRVALLINNTQFADKKLNRCGAEKDERNMTNHLRGLGYEVVKHTNLTGKEINEKIVEFSKHPKLRKTDSVVIVIMSHGKLGVVLGVNYSDENPDEFAIDNIYKHLGSEECPALLDKPKIIIIQACRGDERGSVFVSDAANPDVCCDNVNQPGSPPSAGEEDIEDDTLRRVHKEKDFISLLSCTQDTVSYRQRSCGAFLIQFVIEVSNTFSHKDHIEELFRKVLLRFENLPIGSNDRQMATKDRCSLTKLFYFYPGLRDLLHADA